MQLRDQHHEARRRVRLPLWDPAAVAAIASAGNGPERVFLQRLVDDGDAALQMLALCTGVAPRETLARVLGQGFVACTPRGGASECDVPSICQRGFVGMG